ncbi:STAS domain-containing protein [Bacillus piscicola]|uniref:STAS domain-containing protein n=1 Tax=Bacillus piscicola TaxID=1632684 RepID=UPI001F097B1D|nr:STAS domain-containing protein [Bacillus piscicola]
MKDRVRVLKTIGEEIIKNSEHLNNQITKNSQNRNARFLSDDNPGLGESFFKRLGEDLIGSTSDDIQSSSLIKQWGKQAADYCLEHNIDLSTALKILPDFRAVITHTIEKQCLAAQLSLHDSFIIYGKFESFLDHTAQMFSHAFLNKHIADLDLAKKQMQEISVPVVPIQSGTAVLPLIGDMDDERSEFLQQRTLERATELDLTSIIIDLSGINTINTWFAQHLIQLIDALKLLGIEPSISGMRPELSQTIVHLGITFQSIPKYLTLEQALQQHPSYST